MNDLTEYLANNDWNHTDGHAMFLAEKELADGRKLYLAQEDVGYTVYIRTAKTHMHAGKIEFTGDGIGVMQATLTALCG